jgi:hypothetical protein
MTGRPTEAEDRGVPGMAVSLERTECSPLTQTDSSLLGGTRSRAAVRDGTH